MSAISEIFGPCRYITKCFSPQVEQNVVITNKNVKCELTDELPNDIRLKKNLTSQME